MGAATPNCEKCTIKTLHRQSSARRWNTWRFWCRGWSGSIGTRAFLTMWAHRSMSLSTGSRTRPDVGQRPGLKGSGSFCHHPGMCTEPLLGVCKNCLLGGCKFPLFPMQWNAKAICVFSKKNLCVPDISHFYMYLPSSRFLYTGYPSSPRVVLLSYFLGTFLYMCCRPCHMVHATCSSQPLHIIMDQLVLNFMTMWACGRFLFWNFIVYITAILK